MSRILIIEDNADLAFGLQKTLEFEGHETEVAADGPAGLDRAEGWNPDLVLLDLMLPGMDGYKILKELRARGGKVPVLILTARSEEADVVLGFHSGADDYVTKPFKVDELLITVQRALEYRRAISENEELKAQIQASYGLKTWWRKARPCVSSAILSSGGPRRTRRS